MASLRVSSIALSSCRRRGTHPKVVQEMLGHTTITTTMDTYSHVTPTMQRAAVDRFAAAVKGIE